jgi:hypothetical protein
VPIADGPRAAAGYMSEASLYGNLVTDLTETIPALAWPDSIATYSAMRNDTQVSAILKAYTLPLQSATWVFDPAGCKKDVVRMCADAFGLPILGDDNSMSGPFRRRGVIWEEHLDTALDMLIYGHMPFAIGGEVTGQPLRWKLTELSERLPSTITRINVNDQGHLQSITQYGAKSDIPASNLLWYVHGRRGGNWTGRSMLRESYAPWLLKHEMWRVLATSGRRFGTGIPVVNAPTGATEAQIEYAARLAASMRVGDQSGIGLPEGYTAQIAAMTGTLPDILGFVRYLDQQINTSVLAAVLNLDASPNGSRALGDTMMELLTRSWQAVAREIAIPANRLAANMVDWNYGEDEPVPTLRCIGLNKTTPEAIKLLMDAGAIKYDPNLEAAARELVELPAADPDYEPPAPPMLQPNTDTDPNAVDGDRAPDGAPSGESGGKPGTPAVVSRNEGDKVSTR